MKYCTYPGIVTFKHPSLRKIAAPFIDLPDCLLDEMKEAMKKVLIQYRGAGIAAPQIGYPKQAIMLAEDGFPMYLNPRIIKRSEEEFEMMEGCLSIPGVFGKVMRSKEITFTALLDKKPVTETATGRRAAIIQHEIDHLDGILFIDKAKEIKFEPS